MDEIEVQYNQLSQLDTSSIVSIYGNTAKILDERGVLATTRKELKRILNIKKPQIHDTPDHIFRGKIKRTTAHSILIDFLKEDWGYLFTGNYDRVKRYYVYYHSDPHKPNMRLRKGDKHIEFKGRPFYVGKGTGDRYKSKARSRSHLSIINNIKDKGNIFHIFKNNLNELEALELEAKLITFFGCSAELTKGKTHFHGMKGGLLVNSDPAIRPEDVNLMMKIKGGE